MKQTKLKEYMGEKTMLRINRERQEGDIWKFEIASKIINNFMYFYWILRNERTSEIIWGDRIGRNKDTCIEITAS